MKKIGFLGLGVMGFDMALNIVKKSDFDLIGYDVSEKQLLAFQSAGGKIAENADEIYQTCDVVLQMLPTHEIIINSVRQAIALGKPGNIIVDLSSTAPDIVIGLCEEAKAAGMYLLDSPVSGGNPMAKAGTLSIMTGGDEKAFHTVLPLLECMGHAVYTGVSGSGDTTKLVNNIMGGSILTAIAESYAFAAKAGLDLQTTFDATRAGFAGGPLYDNKVPKVLARDYEPGARIAIHRKDILNAMHYAEKLGVEMPMTSVILEVMDWMNDNGYANEDQAAMVRYYEHFMDVQVGVPAKKEK